MDQSSWLRRIRKVYKPFVIGCMGYSFIQFVARPWRLEDTSMEPTFSDGDLVLTTTLNSKLQKGDIVILKDPFRPDQKICKRVVGLPGSTVNHSGFDIEIPKGQMWIEGDNKTKSLDSRIFGPVSIGLFEGLVFCKLWPPQTYFRKSMMTDRTL